MLFLGDLFLLFKFKSEKLFKLETCLQQVEVFPLQEE